MARRPPQFTSVRAMIPCTGCIRRGIPAERANRVRKGYQCDACADLEEGPGYY